MVLSVQGTDQILSPLCQAVVHSDLLPFGDVSDGDNDQPHLAATVDLSDAAVRGGREGAGCRGWSRGGRGSRSCRRGGQRRGLSWSRRGRGRSRDWCWGWGRGSSRNWSRCRSRREAGLGSGRDFAMSLLWWTAGKESGRGLKVKFYSVPMVFSRIFK